MPYIFLGRVFTPNNPREHAITGIDLVPQSEGLPAINTISVSFSLEYGEV